MRSDTLVPQLRNNLSKGQDVIWTGNKEQECSPELSTLQGKGKTNTSKAPMLLY